MNDKEITIGYDGRTNSVKDKGSDEIDMDDKRTRMTDLKTSKTVSIVCVTKNKGRVEGKMKY